MKTHKIKILVMSALGTVMCVPSVYSQDYYEDDIYYNPSKEEEKVQQPVTQAASSGGTYADGAYYVDNQVTEYPGSDYYYVPAGSLDMDVDTYNRHGQFLVPDSVASVARDTDDSFAYTRRIERFYNPDVVESSTDAELADYYYSEQPATNINVYVVDAYPYYSPYYYYSLWRYGWYSPYYWDVYWGWDPYWSFSWGWDPYWSFSWGWGHSWCHHHCWPATGWWGAGHGWRPSTPGASRPHNPAYAGGGSASRRPGTSGTYPSGDMSRPGNMGRGRYSTTYNGSASRAGTVSGRTVSGTSQQQTARPGNSGRGRSNVTRQSSQTTRNYSTPSRSTTSRSGGYRSTGGGGAGRSTGGGGGSRGRR